MMAEHKCGIQFLLQWSPEKSKILSQTNNPHAGDLMLSPQPASKQAS
jgi:hypothetical protein